MTLRRKSAADTLRPLLEELGTLVGLVTSKATRSQGLALLSGILALVKEVGQWSDTVDREKPDDLKACKVRLPFHYHAYTLKISKAILNNLLDRSLLACEHFIKANIAQRTLEDCYPRLAIRSRTSGDWHEGAETMSKLLVGSFSVSCTPLTCSFRKRTPHLGCRLPLGLPL